MDIRGQDVSLQPTSMLLVRIMIAKVTNIGRLELVCVVCLISSECSPPSLPSGFHGERFWPGFEKVIHVVLPE